MEQTVYRYIQSSLDGFILDDIFLRLHHRSQNYRNQRKKAIELSFEPFLSRIILLGKDFVIVDISK